jgi:autotransporter-associated beta strand protein
MRPIPRHWLLAALVACLGFFPALLSAQTLYWDTNGATPGLGLGDGTWDTTTANWTTSSSGNIAPVTWTNGYIASFTYDGVVTDSVVTLGSDITLAGLVADYNPEAVTIVGNGHQLTLVGSAGITAGALGGLTIDVVIAGEDGLHKTGTYALVLTKANTYTGTTTVDAGGLFIRDNAGLGVAGAGHETVVNAAASVGFGDGLTVAEDFILNGGRLYVDTQAENADVSLTGSIVVNGQATLSGDNSDDSHLLVSGVISESSVHSGLLALNGVTLSGNNTFTGRISAGDGAGLSVAVFNNNGEAGPLGMGSGLLLGYQSEGNVDGRITYTGGSATSNRTIQLVGNSNQIAIANAGTTLTLTGEISDEPCIGSDDNLVKSGPGTLVLRGDNSYQGNTDLIDGTLVVGHNNALGTGPEAEVRVGVEGTDSAANLGLLLEDGVTLGHYVHVYNGNGDGGTTTLGLSGAGEAAFGEEVYITRAVGIDVGSGGTLNFNEFFSDGSGGGSVTKTGAGLVRFGDGIDLRGGGLTIDAGEVRLSPGSNFLYFQNGITVNSGGVLSGLGSVSGDWLLVASGGTLSPGNPVGSLTVQSLTLNAGSNFTWRIAQLTTSDQSQFSNVQVATEGEGDSLLIDSAATLTLDLSLLGAGQRPTNSDFQLNDAFWQTTQTWQLVDFSGPGMNHFNFGGQVNPFVLANAVFAGGVFSTFVGDGSNGFIVGNVYLQFTPVPEPSTWALLATGVAAAGLLASRRKHRASGGTR